MKELYEKPMMEIIIFPEEDIITASGINEMDTYEDGFILDWDQLNGN